jgi:hypothetical protein
MEMMLLNFGICPLRDVLMENLNQWRLLGSSSSANGHGAVMMMVVIFGPKGQNIESLLHDYLMPCSLYATLLPVTVAHCRTERNAHSLILKWLVKAEMAVHVL